MPPGSAAVFLARTRRDVVHPAFKARVSSGFWWSIGAASAVIPWPVFRAGCRHLADTDLPYGRIPYETRP